MHDRLIVKNKRRINYGWWIVLSAFITVAFTLSLKTYTFGVFVKPLSEDMGWSRATVVGVITTNAIVAGILAPFVGRFVDQHGPRLGMFVGGIVAGLSLLSISRIDSLWQWYLLWTVYTVGDAFAGMVPSNTAIANWFVRQRGTAMGITYVAVSVGGIVLVPTTTSIVGTAGWGWGFVLLGLLLALIMAPVSGLVMRRRPEDMGLLPDGATPQAVAAVPRQGDSPSTARSAINEPAWTLGQSARTLPFWLLALGTGFGGGTANIVSVHAMAFSTDLGIAPAGAASAIGLLLFVGMPGRFLYGWLCDRLDIRHVMMLYLSGLVVAAVLMSQTHDLVMLYVSMVVFGLSVGGVNAVPPLMGARLYGRRNFGRIWGTLYFLSIPVTSGAPLLAGYIYDTTGSYQLAFYFAAVGLVTSILGIYFARLRSSPTGATSTAVVGDGPRAERP